MQAWPAASRDRRATERAVSITSSINKPYIAEACFFVVAGAAEVFLFFFVLLFCLQKPFRPKRRTHQTTATTDAETKKRERATKSTPLVSKGGRPRRNADHATVQEQRTEKQVITRAVRATTKRDPPTHEQGQWYPADTPHNQQSKTTKHGQARKQAQKQKRQARQKQPSRLPAQRAGPETGRPSLGSFEKQHALCKPLHPRHYVEHTRSCMKLPSSSADASCTPGT